MILQADVSDDPLQVFEMVERAGVGRCHALLYEAHAAVAEKRHMFALAQEVYMRGLSR